jgi:hypothetical protein
MDIAGRMEGVLREVGRLAQRPPIQLTFINFFTVLINFGAECGGIMKERINLFKLCKIGEAVF